MTIGSEILRAKSNLKDCYDVCESVNPDSIPADKNFDNLAACIEQAKNPFNKPSDWSDIRTDCPENSIALYAGHSEDYSSYDNLGFTATCVGGYNVYIDGTQYGNTYASGAQCNITWSSLALTTGDDITTPSALKAHKIWIEPATEGNNITAFKCARVAASGNEQQGVLWTHFNIDNAININNLFYADQQYRNEVVVACTSKNNTLKVSGLGNSFYRTLNITYLPVFDLNSTSVYGSALSAYSGIKEITIKNGSFLGTGNMFYYSSKLEKVKGNAVYRVMSGMFNGCYALKEFPSNLDFSQSANLTDFAVYCGELKDTILDTRAGTGITKLGCYGSATRFMSGLKGLRVSNEAPFNNATAPQINVNYTGLDRTALVQLFNDLPYNIGYEVVGSPTIAGGVLSNFSTANYVAVSNTAITNKMTFKTKLNPASENPSGQINLILFNGYGFGIFAFANGAVRLQIKDNGGTYRTLGIGTTDETMFIKAEVKQESIDVYKSSDGTSYSLIGTIDYPITSLAGAELFLGRANGYTGSIGLSDTSIDIENTHYFKGQPARVDKPRLSCVGCYGNQDKLTIVGSPTINNGVMSNYSSSNYVTVNNDVVDNSMEFYTKLIKGSSAPSGQANLLLFSGYGFGIYAFANGDIRLQIKDTDGNYRSLGLGTVDDVSYLKFIVEPNKIEAYKSSDGITYTLQGTLDYAITSLLNAVLSIGRTDNYTSGSIDLNETYIKVNNELWFGREQYLLPEDKDIAEKQKNWELTLAA